jgi:glucose/arabinose dehydrogenase/regulation of enolase protein 1 (concanavalin A-like superfamily)
MKRSAPAYPRSLSLLRQLSSPNGPRAALAWLLAGWCVTLSLLSTPAQTFSDPGFVAETVVTLPPYKPVGLTWAPDGRIFIWQEDGIVRIVKNGALLPTPFIDIRPRVNTVNDRGMLGLALHPNFASNGYVYLLYTYEEGNNPNDPAPKTARLTRVQANPANPDVALAGSEVVILGSIGVPPCDNYPAGSDCIGSDYDSHTIGTVRFAPDGKLFVSVGDGASYDFVDARALRAQNLNRYEGKILRINPDGSAPGDNPFDDGTNSIRSKIYSYGLRNPYRFALHPVTGEPYIGDVGWGTWEEQNRGRGANFGWPCYEGPNPLTPYQNVFPQCRALAPSAVTAPIYTYNHNGSGAAAIGGTFYSASAFPAQYHGNYFFADYVQDWIRRMTFDANGNVTGVHNFAANLNGVVTLEQGPDGALYYISLPTGQVRRMRFATAPPVAVASATPTSGYSPLTVTFSSGGSSDPNGSPLTYRWEFGDGAISTSPNPTHTYTASSAQIFTAKLTVTNAQGLSSSTTVKITVGSLPPSATILAPSDGARFNPGETVIFQGLATDPDESLPPNALSWTVLLHHNEHVHPYLNTIGTQGSFVVEAHGDGTFYWEIVLTATDSTGLTDTKRVNIYPASSSGSLPAPWANQDVGAVGLAGSASYLSGAFTLQGSGADIWNYNDAFQFVYQPLTGDGQITARVASLQNTHGWAKAGVMVRESLTATARHAMMVITPSNGTAFQRRVAVGGDSLHTAGGSVAAPYWVRIVRSGGVLTGYQSSDGVSWTQVGTATISLPASVWIGLVVTSHNDAALSAASFDQVAVSGGGGPPANAPPVVSLTAPTSGASFTAPASITLTATASDSDGTISKVEFYQGSTLLGSDTTAPYEYVWSGVAAGNYSLTARATDNSGAVTTSGAVSITVTNPSGGGLPSPWTNQDVGAVGLAGSATHTGGTFTLQGSGADIWNYNDAFQFVYQPLTGDGQITARVASLQNTHGWAKAGVMVRESLTATARHAMMVITPSNGTAFQRRVAVGGDSLHTAGGSVAAPYWVRIVRSGGVLTGYQSSDGVSWTQVGTATISLPASVWIGLVVTSHNDAALSAASFDQVAVSGGGGPPANAPPVVSLTAPTSGASFTAPASITLTATASDSDGTISKVEFYQGSTLLGSDTTAPYEYVWSGVAAGNYSLTARATDNGGAVTASSAVAITVNSASSSNGLRGEYYDNIDFTALMITRVDATVNFDWGGGSPGVSIGANTFSVRWTGQVQPLYSQTYTFYTTSDDGVRLWVNGQLIVDNWTDHAATENNGTITLVAGQRYDIKLEYYERNGQAVIKLAWSSPSQAKEIIPTSRLFSS